ncbi:MAG: 16S rRNA (guanine(527)-N(7))-methyltransferase RsmG [Bacteroidales bacterium]
MESILQYFPTLTSQQIKQFELLMPLYSEWNSKINLISRKDIVHLYERHVLHSLSLAAFFDFKNETFLDVGTGGGFPGIPLAILKPNCQFTLADSIGKKIKAVQEISKALQLKNVKAVHINVKEHKEKYDYIIGRSVCNFSEFIALTAKNLKNNASILYLKGGDLSQELGKYVTKTTIFNIYEKFPIPFFETKKIVWLKSEDI